MASVASTVCPREKKGLFEALVNFGVSCILNSSAVHINQSLMCLTLPLLHHCLAYIINQPGINAVHVPTGIKPLLIFREWHFYLFQIKKKPQKKFPAIVSKWFQELNTSKLSGKYSAAVKLGGDSYKSDIYSFCFVLAAKVKHFKGGSSNSWDWVSNKPCIIRMFCFEQFLYIWHKWIFML